LEKGVRKPDFVSIMEAEYQQKIKIEKKEKK
jgi:hypothetical protein